MAQSGILLIDKSEGWTSHDAVARTRRFLGTRKVGHAGTLDPMATGLLVLGAESSTRLLTYLVGLDKEYETVIRLGISTVTDDREGTATAVGDPYLIAKLSPAAIAAEAAKLTGDIQQAPSAVSAIKVDGRRAYDRVRAGEDVELPKRPVTVHEFELGEMRVERLSDAVTVVDIPARVRCSSGTYIRALARDLGAALGVGGHLISLRRTSVGPFQVTDARSIEDLDAAANPAAGDVAADPASFLLDPAEVARGLFPALELSEQQAIDLGQGKKLDVPDAPDAEIAAAIAPAGSLVGLVRIRAGKTRVLVNFPTGRGAAAIPAGGDRG